MTGPTAPPSSGRVSAAGGWGKRRGVLRTLSLLLAPFAVAVALLWLGGAVEILIFDDGEPGDECWAVDGSTAAPGREVDRWIGGGMFGRPGAVCEAISKVNGEPVPTGLVDRHFTHADALSAVLAAIAFVVASIVVFEKLRPERRGPW